MRTIRIDYYECKEIGEKFPKISKGLEVVEGAQEVHEALGHEPFVEMLMEMRAEASRRFHEDYDAGGEPRVRWYPAVQGA